jgi:hypothetical protein
VPLRPGERFRPAGFARGDARLARWNRPLDTGRVFVRGGPNRREWRDYSAVRTERQAEIRKTRAAQPRPDTRTVRPERRAVRTPAAVERKNGKQVRQPASRPALREDRGNETTRRAVPGPGNVERQTPLRSVPAARPPERERMRESEPRVDRSGGPPDRSGGARGIVQERAPAGRSPDPGSRGQETRGNRGGDEGGGSDRGGDRGGGRGDDRGGDRGGGRGDDRGGDRGGGGRYR